MIKENFKKSINSILYVRLPCPKIWPVSLVYLADHIHKECPNVKQRILDLSLVEPEDESKTLIKTIEEFNPQAIAFSLRVIQPFSPEEGDPSLINAFNFYFSRNPIKKIKSALFGAKSVATYQNRTKKTLALINEASNKFGDRQILIGGPAFSVFWNFIMPRINNKAIGVVGEAENALLKIIKGLPLEEERFVWQENGSVKCGVQKQFVDLSQQTPVDFGYIESIYPGFKEYLDEPIGVQTKRGCPYSCLYCLYNYIEGKKVRYRNPQVIGQEIETLNKEYGIKKIWFCDSQFFPAKKDFAICERTLDEIIKRKLDIQWTSYMRIEHINKNIAEKMLASGVSDFELSINSGSQKVINALKLGFRLEKFF
ncbi:MAG: radical SAM protein, partial [Actinobacteria bacterium]